MSIGKDLKLENKELIISSKDLSKYASKETLFLLCTEDKDYAIRKILSLGFDEDNYILAEELLLHHELINTFYQSDITVFGIGNTYEYWKNDLNESKLNITRFALTKREVDKFNQKDVININELENFKGKTRIVVTSIYYNEIYKSLISKGFAPGVDFIHIDTFLILNNLSKNININYKFINRSEDNKSLLVVLSGYKEILWGKVFDRLKKYCPRDFDVCIVTSGKNDIKLQKLCEENNWSYLSTAINNVSAAINLAIDVQPKAKMIFKMDEDIFVTKGTFETLLSTYNRVEKESNYEVGFVSPLIPVNGYGYARILDILNIRDKWEKRFGEIKITDCYHHHRSIYDNPETAEFLWGGCEECQKIDSLQDMLQTKSFSYSICPIRYSIGLIGFSRSDWLRMGMFPVSSYDNLGADEKRICKYCLMEGKAMVISENCVVGHFSYWPQRDAMKTYFFENNDDF